MVEYVTDEEIFLKNYSMSFRCVYVCIVVAAVQAVFQLSEVSMSNFRSTLGKFLYKYRLGQYLQLSIYLSVVHPRSCPKEKQVPILLGRRNGCVVK